MRYGINYGGLVRQLLCPTAHAHYRTWGLEHRSDTTDSEAKDGVMHSWEAEYDGRKAISGGELSGGGVGGSEPWRRVVLSV